MYHCFAASHMPSRCGSRQSDTCDAMNANTMGHAAAACLILFAAFFSVHISVSLALLGLLGSLIRLIIKDSAGTQPQMTHL